MNDTIVTFTGNLTADPELRQTPNGVAVASIRVAATQRRFDRGSQSWSDGATNFFKVTCWRGLGVRVAESLRKGDPVFVSGKFTCSTYETERGPQSANEVDAVVVGPDLTRVSAVVHRRPREVTTEHVPAQPAPAA